MASGQSLSLDQRIGMRLTAQQLRFVKLLEFNAPELEEAIERELEDNPALEAVPDESRSLDNLPHYRTNINNASPDDFSDYDFSPPDTGESLYDSLSRQLSERDISPEIRETAEYIIGNLDSNGYLRRPLPSIVNDMTFGPGIEVSLATASQALEIIKDLEPYGVGASDLRECLLIQLRHLEDSPAVRDAISIIDTQFEAFSMKHTHSIISALKIGKERVSEAISLILTLNPKPGAAVNEDPVNSNVIIPDLIVNNDEGHLSISLNNRIPELTIDRSFSEAVREMEEGAKKRSRKGSEFITSRYNDADRKSVV